MIRPATSSLFLGAACARQSASTQLRSQARRTYASAAPSSGGSNLPLLLGVAGLGGLGGFYYLGGFKDPKAAKDKAAELAKDAKAQAGAAAGSVTGAALAKDAFKEFTLKEIKPYNHDSSILVFELPDGASSGLSTASAVLLKAAGEGLKGADGKEVIRPYTPISTPESKGHIDFLIKRYEDGNMSKHATSLKTGDKLAIKGPIPKFPYKANEFQEIACIAGGTGITPMWQVIQTISQNPEDKTKVTLIYTNKSQDDILLREEFDKLAQAKPEQYKVLYGVDKAPTGWSGFTGYITPELLSKHLPAPGLADKIKLFVCGPPPQVEAISGGKGPKGSQGDLKGLLADAGYEPSQVYKF